MKNVSFATDNNATAPATPSYQELASPHPSLSHTPVLPQLHRRRIVLDVVDDGRAKGPMWLFPSRGNAQHVQAPEKELQAIEDKLREPRHRLSEWPSTAISGNDLLSSVLYAASLVAAKAGKLMPVPFLLVSLVLYFFRFIYEEVVSAIPLNGGSYNALLNTTSKRTSSVAAALSILSYTATAVVSATTGVKYFAVQVEIPYVESTVAMLFVFACVALLGITESSRVAAVIFFHNAIVLIVVMVACAVHWVQHPDVFIANMKTDFPAVDFCGSMLDGNVATALFFGFGASMLGVTGFETSANFVEEQEPGVFPKTMRNMWALSTVFNFVLGVLIMAVLPLEGENNIADNADALLAQVGYVAAGKWLQTWVSIDALIVLAGAVLTSYVGVIGLVRRLANDRVLPAFLAQQNQWRGTNHYIILLFFMLAASLVIVLNADSTILGGVFTYAFLSLMLLFSCGCMLLKAKRAEIPTATHAPWSALVFGFIMVVIAIFANLLGDPQILMYFALYFLAIASVMFIMLERVMILRAILAVLKKILPSRHNQKAATMALLQVETPPTAHPFEHTGVRGGKTITNAIIAINQAPIIFFCKFPDLTILNKAVLYVRRNEQTHNLRIVHVYNNNEGGGNGLEEGGAGRYLAEFDEMVALFDHMYPKLRIDFVSVQGDFTPAMVQWIAQSMCVPTNMMFIKQPSNVVAHQVSSCGVRVITA